MFGRIAVIFASIGVLLAFLVVARPPQYCDPVWRASWAHGYHTYRITNEKVDDTPRCPSIWSRNPF